MSLFSLSLRNADPPAAALEIGARGVTAARVEARGGQLTVAAHATEPLPEGVVAPSLAAANVKQREAAAAAVSRALDRIGRPRRVALVLPDPVAKVSILRFEQVPDRARDLAQLIAWQLRKSSPFPLEEGQLSFVKGAAARDGQEFIVTTARRDVIVEYESLVSAAGAHAGIVDLSTFNVANVVLAGQRDLVSADWLLVNVADDWASAAILRGSHVTLFRSRSGEGDGTLADLVHQTSMYYEDRLGGAGFAAVVLNGASRAVEQSGEAARRSLEERLGTAVTLVDPRRAAAFADRIAAPPDLLESLAPLVGVLARDREEAA
jgi:Tfp pilus assembly PilM family ATPase